jgi:broad specificity phosphatase PhoE
MVRNLYLIRHGETEWNEAGLLQGQTDVPLTEVGRRQALCLAARLKDFSVTSVYASPLARAFESATLIFPGRTIVPLPGLMERHLGELQGLTREEAAKRFPPYASAGTSLLEEAPPGGESMAEFSARVLAAYQAMRGDDVAVVAHGGSISVLLAHLLGIPRGRIRLDNASLSIVANPQEVWQVRVLNSTAHLS